MKKIIKEYFTYVLAMILTLTSFPVGALAANVDVNVNITGIPSIEYVATISSDINIDLTKSNVGTSYLKIDNNSNLYMKSTITDIEANTEGAPNNFVAPTDKNWSTLTAEETAKYISFEVLGKTIVSSDNSVNVVEGGVLYPEGTEEYTGFPLAVLTRNYEYVGDTDTFIYDYHFGKKDKKVYTLNTRVGYAWEEEKKLSYSITILTEFGGTEKDLVPNISDKSTKAIYDATVEALVSYNGLFQVNVHLLTGSERKIVSSHENQANDESMVYLTLEESMLNPTEEYSYAFGGSLDASSIINGAKYYNSIDKEWVSGEIWGSPELSEPVTVFIPYTLVVTAPNNSTNQELDRYIINGVLETEWIESVYN